MRVSLAVILTALGAFCIIAVATADPQKLSGTRRLILLAIGIALALPGCLILGSTLSKWNSVGARWSAQRVTRQRAAKQPPTVREVKRTRRISLALFFGSVPVLVLAGTLVPKIWPAWRPSELGVTAVGAFWLVVYAIAVGSVLIMADAARKIGYPRGRLLLYQVLALTPLLVFSAAIFDRALRDFIRSKSEHG